VKPPIRWFGGKGLIAEKIVALFPPHRLYLEPFAGSLAVLYAKSPVPIEIVNDQHQDLVNLYRVMRQWPGKFQRAVRMMLFSRDECRDGHRPDPTLPPVERAARFFAYCWFNHGSAAGRKTISGFTSHSPNSYSEKIHQWGDAKGRLPMQCARLESVVIERRDAVKLITKYEKYGTDTLIYCDPPYVLGGARKDGHPYHHEMDEADHAKLASVLAACSCNVALSYYEDPLVRDLYPDHTRGGQWTWTPIDGARRNTLSQVNEPAPEVLITNYDPLASTPLFAGKEAAWTS